MANCSEKNPSIWEGVYSTWKEAAGVGKGFSGERWLNRIVQQLEDYLEDRRLHGIMAQPPRPCSLPTLCSLTNPDSIVDFGGSSGWVWYYLNESIANLSVRKYDILEIEEICQHFKNSNYHHHQPIDYFTLQDSIRKYDILYTNSVLQYIDNDELFLDLIERTKPKYILIEDILGGDFDDYYSSQIYYDNRIPVKFRNKEKFIQGIEALSFKLLLSQDYITKIRGETQPFPMSNLPKDKRVKYGQTLLFERLDQ